jgi:hypothetical protein
MSPLQKILSVLAAISKYGALASAAVQLAQSEVGASAGNPMVQQSKKQIAVTYVLAAAHAGEAVPNSTVQEIAGVVDLVAGTAKALGLFGKIPSAGVVSVPANEAGAK